MGAYRCNECELWLPAQERNECPVCMRLLVFHTAESVPRNWRKQVERVEEKHVDKAEDQLTEFRRQVFVELGVPDADARHMAARRDVDWHLLQRILKGGCDMDTALRIVC